jgi:hypothetical protein
MTVKKGATWGRPFDGDQQPRRVADDIELASLAYRCHRDGVPLIASVSGGDLLIGLGHGEASSAAPAVAYPMDLGLAEFGRIPEAVDATVPFVAHVVGYRRRWRPLPELAWPDLIVMNAPLLGRRRLGPKAHPNDGVVDITIGLIPWPERREAARRARSGSHLPHPNLKTKRTSTYETALPQPLRFVVDGRDQGRWQWLRVSVVPDAFVLVAGETSVPEGL